jgi:hypothetical protein
MAKPLYLRPVGPNIALGRQIPGSHLPHPQKQLGVP